VARRMGQDTARGAALVIQIDGRPVTAFAGESVAAAMLATGILKFRTNPRSGEPRGPFCLMGSCQECLVHIDGARRLACQCCVADGLVVRTAVS